MNEQVLYSSIRFGIVLIAFGFVVFMAWRRTALDVFRSDLFALRDHLFDFMWENGHDFETMAYRRLRDEINGFLRFGHQFDLASIVTVSLITKMPAEQHELLSEIDLVDNSELKLYLRSIYHEVGRRTFRYLCVGGSQAVFLIPLIIFYVLMRNGGKWLTETPAVVADRMASLGRVDSPILGYIRSTA